MSSLKQPQISHLPSVLTLPSEFTPLKSHTLSSPPPTLCRSSSSSKKFKKCVWRKEQDNLLRQKVQEKGPTQWAQIACFLPGRSGKQCRERWHNHLREGVSKQAWSPHEYWILALCVKAFGKKWSAISDYIPGRSDNTIKNQWNCKMKPYKQQFQRNIQTLKKHPEAWSKLSADEETLMKIIVKKGPSQSEDQEKIMNIFQSYCSLLKNGLSKYFSYKESRKICIRLEQKFIQTEEKSERIKNQIFFQSSSESQCEQSQEDHQTLHKIQLNPECEDNELSAGISAGDCIFYDSSEQNPIMPMYLKR